MPSAVDCYLNNESVDLGLNLWMDNTIAVLCMQYYRNTIETITPLFIHSCLLGSPLEGCLLLHGIKVYYYGLVLKNLLHVYVIKLIVLSDVCHSTRVNKSLRDR